MISRELYELRDALDQHHDTDFLTIGAMGHCSQIALGVALANQNKPVLCLDGDGAAIMHMGSLAIMGQAPIANLRTLKFRFPPSPRSGREVIIIKDFLM